MPQDALYDFRLMEERLQEAKFPCYLSCHTACRCYHVKEEEILALSCYDKYGQLPAAYFILLQHIIFL